MPPRTIRWIACAMLGCAGVSGWGAEQVSRNSVEAATVYFPSADAKTELVAYLFEPEGAGPHPAVVMLHGRAGPYSSNVNAGCTFVARGQTSACNATTLSKRHEMWGEYWAAHGYVALLVDSFGPRGRGHGYGRYTHDDPDRDAVNERTVRPLDAEGALAWLAARQDIRRDRVMLQGWSNGGSTTLNAMYRQATGTTAAGTNRFRAALVFYPGCGPRSLISQRYQADTSVWAFLGSDDEEVSPSVCSRVLKSASGTPVTVTLFDGATHDFDDPGPTRQSVAANRAAKADTMQRAATLLDALP